MDETDKSVPLLLLLTDHPISQVNEYIFIILYDNMPDKLFNHVLRGNISEYRNSFHVGIAQTVMGQYIFCLGSVHYESNFVTNLI